jgi:hypothetical protein
VRHCLPPGEAVSAAAAVGCCFWMSCHAQLRTSYHCPCSRVLKRALPAQRGGSAVWRATWREFARVCGATARALLPYGGKFSPRGRGLMVAGQSFSMRNRAHNHICGDAEMSTEVRGYDIAVQAESSSETRRTVMEMFPGAVVTGVQPSQVTGALPKL